MVFPFQGILANPALIGISWGLAALMVVYCGARVYQSFQKTKNRSVGDFARYLLIAGVGMLIPIVSYLLGGVDWLRIGFGIGVFVKLIGLAFLVRLVLSYIWPKLEKIGFYLLLVFNFGVLPLNLTYATVNFPGLNPQTGQFPINLPVGVGLVSFLFLLPALIIPGIVFVKKGLQSEDKSVRLRGTLIGLGLILFVISIATCGIVTRVIPLFFNNVLVALSGLIVMLGINSAFRKEKPEKIFPPTVSNLQPYTPIQVNW